MKINKKLVILTVIFCFAAQIFCNAFASNSYVNNAIRKYKRGNYTGCLQDLQYYVKKDPSNAMAYYYLAMSYARAGKKSQALGSYKKVMALSTNKILTRYATKGYVCLNNPKACGYADGTAIGTVNDVDKAVNSRSFVSPKASSTIETTRLNTIRQKINNGSNVTRQQFNKVDVNDYHSEVPTSDKTALNSTDTNQMPTNAEIASAIKVLKKAGLLNVAVSENTYNANVPQNNVDNPQLAQLYALLGNNTNNNNTMSGMLPYLTSNANGGNQTLSKQTIQNLMMNSMLPSLDVNFNDKDENK